VCEVVPAHVCAAVHITPAPYELEDGPDEKENAADKSADKEEEVEA
jgi:hypothetical protein